MVSVLQLLNSNECAAEVMEILFLFRNFFLSQSYIQKKKKKKKKCSFSFQSAIVDGMNKKDHTEHKYKSFKILTHLFCLSNLSLEIK